MRKFAIIVPLSLITIFAIGQHASLKGSVRDTSEKRNLSNTVVSLLRKNDSVLVSFTRTNPSGQFSLKNIKPGNYIIMVTRPLYAGFVDFLTFKKGENKDMGMVILTPAGKLLEEVIVRQNRSIVIKGDTIEYKADSFKVSAGANVQELLRKMPGLEVDRKGVITSHGKKVDKILVDGEEFFSDDPAVVTQNLRADAIDKVQSFDKKSDQSEFTGVDDGTRSKTLNLVLKEDKKKGFFGKISLAHGTRERSTNEAMLNLFKGKKKFSVFGIVSNTGKIGLDWDDREKFGGGLDLGEGTMEVGPGIIMFSGGNDWEFNDWGDNYWGEGVPRNIKTGAHFSNKWGKDRYHINGNYSFNQQKNNSQGGSLSKYILPDSAYYFSEDHHNISSQQRHLFSGFYDFKLDSFASIRVRLNGLMGFDNREQHTQSGSDDVNQKPVNRNRRDNISDIEDKTGMASILYKQRFKKVGRTFSLNGSYKHGERNSTGYLNSFTDYYDPGGLIIDQDSIDQQKLSFARNTIAQGKVVYTEPLGKKVILELNYNYNQTINLSDRKSYDKDIAGKYEVLNPDFSSRYTLEYSLNSAGLKFQYNSKKFVANIGANGGESVFMHKDSQNVTVNNLKYRNISPTARFTFKFSTQRSLNINYGGYPQYPTIEQVQPLKENLDPLNITIGNPNLNEGYSHNISLSFNDFKALSGRSIWINTSYNLRQNAIVTSQVIDSGKRTTQYVNADGVSNYWVNASYHFKWKKPNINISFRVGGSGSQAVSFVNNQKDNSDNIRLNGGINFYKDKEDKYNISYGNNFSWHRNVSSISTASSEFWTQNHNFGLEIYIKKKWEIGTDVNIELREKVDAFDKNNNVTNWSAYIEKKIFKKNNGEIRLQAFDILDQRIGFDRTITSNYLTERTYEVLRQYFLLSFTWNFSKNPGEK